MIDHINFSTQIEKDEDGKSDFAFEDPHERRPLIPITIEGSVSNFYHQPPFPFLPFLKKKKNQLSFILLKKRNQLSFFFFF